MATVEEQINSQIANIERSTGRSMAEWIEIVRASGLEKHRRRWRCSRRSMAWVMATPT